jgi:glycosyltransferase involved in cell wall biosynthesis
MKYLLFYDDSVGFGGHSITAIDALRYLLKDNNLVTGFIFYEGNTRLQENLLALQQQSPHLRLYPIPYRTGKLSTIASPFLWSQHKVLRQIFDKVKPVSIIFIQGSIEASACGLLIAKRGGYHTISFMPLTHSNAEMGGKLSWLRDRINHYYFRLPDHFIVTSQSAKERLFKHGITTKSSLVYYGPDLTRLESVDRQKVRSEYCLAEGDYVIGLIARIQFIHKAHDFLIRALSTYSNQLENIKFLIVGDGPDDAKLQGMIASHNLEGIVTLLPWNHNMSEVYSALDMLIIPSRFEGLPLVMLEAMYYNLPIIASDVDGMAEILPQDWLFKFGDCHALVETLLRVKAADNKAHLNTNRLRILQEFNADEFGKHFHQVIDSLTNSDDYSIIEAERVFL